MNPLIAQMIQDATTVIDRALAAGYRYASQSAYLGVDPVREGAPAKYRGVIVERLNMLGLYVPKDGAGGRFLLIACPGEGTVNAPTYVVTQVGGLATAGFIGGHLALTGVDSAGITGLANHIRAALSA